MPFNGLPNELNDSWKIILTYGSLVLECMWNKLFLVVIVLLELMKTSNIPLFS